LPTAVQWRIDGLPTRATEITLAAGASTNFSGSYIANSDCCAVIDTLTARGNDNCTGNLVTNTATAVCPLLISPAITVTLSCPPGTVPVGGLFVFSGSVSNAGDVTLTEVFVVSSQPVENTPVLGAIELAPGSHRRNIVTRGVALNHLVGREFTVGGARQDDLRRQRKSVAVRAGFHGEGQHRRASVPICARTLAAIPAWACHGVDRRHGPVYL
jgi:hypothetical protein